MACIDAINGMLPRLTRRFGQVVIAAALAEHVGVTLRLLVKSGKCSPEQTRRLLKHIDDLTFGAAYLDAPNEE